MAHRIFKWYIVILSICSTFCARFPPKPGHAMSRNFYEILKIPRNASPQMIKKSFRELSRTKHPDSGGSTEEYINIRDAYEVLSDPKKKNLYDQYGEAGLDPNYMNSQGGGHPFPDFGGAGPFGGAGQFFFFPQAGPDFHFSFEDGPGGGPFQQHRSHVQAEDPYGEKVPDNLHSLDGSKLEKFLNDRNWIALIQFYAPNSRRSLNFKNVYNTLVEQYGEIMLIGVVNCQDSSSACQKYGVERTPQLLLWMPPSHTGKKLIRYEGKLALKEVKEWLNLHVPPGGLELNTNNFEDWLGSDPQKEKILLVTNKNIVPLLFRSIASDFNRRFSFGFIFLNKKEGKSLAEKYIPSWKQIKLPELPALLHITDIDSITGEWIPLYRNARNSLVSKLSRISVQARSVGQFVYFQQLQRRQYDLRDCNPRDKKICILVILNGILPEDEECPFSTDMKKIAKDHQNEPLKIFWVDGIKQAHFIKEVFDIKLQKNCSPQALCDLSKNKMDTSKILSCIQVVAYNSRKKKYKIMQVRNTGLMTTQINDFIDNILGGMSLPSKILKKIPPFI